ncbi:methyltransferase family protein [Jejuia pallidilutea]|uniref:Methyltransferase family protein n=1 Tax=Jejuia pallidilutea TaxID=504487 RepID=A0A362X614_9FLAO|nr:class I SAM-dependent methyltransferase [Jejuia pallidilutea]PQV48271.1 methyltransferase family protein [Jejuia pallidilutea]
MEEFWNSRYKEKKFAYGKAPNQFFKDTIDNYNLQGSILLPAEGEGRNAVYAAQKGFNVTAFDISVEGKNKAEALASQNNTKISYTIGELHHFNFKHNSFDVIALIYAHFPKDRLQLHRQLAELVKPNGYIILEGFSKEHLLYREKHPSVGGPANPNLLFTKEEIQHTFKNFEIIRLEQTETVLKEGDYHNGLANVIRFIGKKTDY